MMRHATGSFEVKSWDEKSYSESDGQPKLTRADVVYTYHGDLEGVNPNIIRLIRKLADSEKR